MKTFHIIIILIAAVFLGLWIRSERTVGYYENVVNEKEAELYRKDSLWRARNDAVLASIPAIRQSYQNDIASLTELINGLKSNVANLQSIIKAGLNTVDTVELIVVTPGDPVYKTDSLDRYRYTDRWATFDLSRTAQGRYALAYTVMDSLTMVWYWKKRIFKYPILEGEAISHNPNTMITGLSNITVPPPPRKRLWIGPQAGYGLAGAYIGIGITYGIIGI